MNEKWREKFAWSHSRQQMFSGCKLQYYYNYIAPWGPKSELTENLWALKKLTSLIFWQGSLVHDVVGGQIGRQKIGMEMGLEIALAQVDALVGETAKKRNLGLVFVEVANGGKIAPDDFETIRLEGRHQVENFFERVWPRYYGMDVVSVEEFGKFILDGIPVTVKLDLVLVTWDGMVFIVDWKTGKVHPEDAADSSQITTYVLSRTVQAGTPPEMIGADLVFLKTGEVFSTSRNLADLEGAKGGIISGAKEMLAVKTEADFPASPKEWLCRSCQFATVCDEGRRIIG